MIPLQLKMNLTVRLKFFDFKRNEKSNFVFVLFSTLEIFQRNRLTYERVRAWFDQLDTYRRTLISRQLENYPPCDDITQSARKFFPVFFFSFRLKFSF